MGEFSYASFDLGIPLKGSVASHQSFVMDIQRLWATSIITYAYLSVVSFKLVKKAHRVFIMDMQRHMATSMGGYSFASFGFGLNFKGKDASLRRFVMDMQRHMATGIVTYTFRVFIIYTQRRVATSMGEFSYLSFGYGVTLEGSDGSRISFLMDIRRRMATSIVRCEYFGIVKYTYFSMVSLLLLRGTLLSSQYPIMHDASLSFQSSITPGIVSTFYCTQWLIYHP